MSNKLIAKYLKLFPMRKANILYGLVLMLVLCVSSQVSAQSQILNLQDHSIDKATFQSDFSVPATTQELPTTVGVLTVEEQLENLELIRIKMSANLEALNQNSSTNTRHEAQVQKLETALSFVLAKIEELNGN